jgi:hypothetical protein
MGSCPLVCALALLVWNAAAAEVEFNRDIRPILSDKCYPCHGPDAANRKTALRFDLEDGTRVELRNHRPAIVPGDPGRSEMYRRIASDRQADRMPPAYLGQDRLSPKEIGFIRQWIEEGAKWEKHWSFLPLRRPAPPQVAGGARPRHPIDSFVLARLGREGLRPSAEADRATLIRRVTLDLTGLPPTPEEVNAFVRNPASDAYEKVVDRLLASPRYGERMAIRWLEAARYSDTNGYQTDGERSMWRWRDWVIDAFNRNMPFDRFTVEQIAGDLLPDATLDQVIATGFNRNHRTSGEGGIVPEEFRVEYVAERTDTTSMVWLGLTMGCARCHDHKYDPISQRDFYRLFAYFNNVPEKGLVYNFGNEEPYVKAPTPEQQARLAELDAKTAAAEQAYAALEAGLAKAQAAWEKRLVKSKPVNWSLTDGLVLQDPTPHRFDGTGFVDAGNQANFNYLDPFTLAAWITPASPDGAILSRTEDYFEGEGYGLYLVKGKLRLHIIKRWTDIGLRVETEKPVELNRRQHVIATYDGYRKSEGVRLYIDGRPRKLKVLFDDLNYPLGAKDPIRIGGGGGLRFRGTIADVRVYKIALTPEQATVIPVAETVNQIAAVPPVSRTAAQTSKLAFCFLDRFAPRRIRQARAAVLAARTERRKYFEGIQTVMVMQESPQRRDTFLLKRGAYDNPGEKVSPGVPGFLPPPHPEWPANRMGLARWLVDPGNPLTARVTVNRFWQMYFGVGLVKTVEDFGAQGEWPIHQDLLDWLASEFVASGWNVKALQKTIVMSATYRQSSRATPELLQKDPENRLLARGPRFRLPPEMIRDQALALSGLLVEQLGGPSVKPYQPPGLWQELAGGKGYVADHGAGLYRRSLYTYWRRTVAPPSMMIFDSPNRETCAVRETRTNTPLQALDLMNDVTYVEAARRLAERILTEGGRAAEDRVGWAWRLALARPPKPAETQVLLGVLRQLEHSYKTNEGAAREILSEGESPRNRKLDACELASYTGVASLILNLDETVTKE